MKSIKLLSFIVLIASVTSFLTYPSVLDHNITQSSTNDAENISLPYLSPLVSENETLLVHNMDVKVKLDNSLKITSTYVFANNDSQPIGFFLLEINATIGSVYSFDPLGPLVFSWSITPYLSNLINITLRQVLLPGDFCVFSTSYEIEDIIYQIQEPMEFSELDFEIQHPRKTTKFNLEVSLPVYASLLIYDPPGATFPDADKIYEEDEVVRVAWTLYNKDTLEEDFFIIRFVLEPLEPVSNSKLQVLYYLLTLVGGIGVGLGAAILYIHLKRKPAESELVTSLLTKTEQEVIKAINSDKGVSTQRRICEKTGYSKSKVSQILAKLEEKNVLKRERWGRTNKVTITNPSFKALGTSEELTETTTT